MFGTRDKVDNIVQDLNQDVDQNRIGSKSGQEIADQLLSRDALREAPNPNVKRTTLQTLLDQNNEIYEMHYYREITSSIPILGKLLIFFKKLIRRGLFYLIQPMVDEQNRFHVSVTQSLNEMNNVIEGNNEVSVRNNEVSVRNTLELQSSLQKQQKDYEELERKVKAQEHLIAILEEDLAKLTDWKQVEALKINKLKQQMEGTAPTVRTQTATDDKEVGLPTPKVVRDTYELIDYIDFENHFRGSQESIRKSQEIYVPYFEGKENVLDMGCGRGEFLTLLRENDIPAKGVDLYEEFVDLCVDKGLRAECGDAIACLRAQENDSLGGVFAAQLVEHLSPEQVNTICSVAYEKLKKGSCIILETPNPRCLSIYSNAFYIDPTHIKPVHPETLKYYMQQAGFSDIEIVFTESSRIDYRLPLLNAENVSNLAEFNDGMALLTEMLFGSQDYAIIARK